MTGSAVLRRNARNPHVAGALVGGSAFVFTLSWLVVGAVTGGFGGTPDQQTGFWAFCLLAVPPNAYTVTRLCWRRWAAPRTSLSRRRAGMIGTVVGLVSYVTLAVLLGLTAILAALALGGGSSVGPLATFLNVVILGTAIGFYVTAGIPVVLSVCIALLLAHLDPGGPDGRHRPPGARNPREHVRPPH